MKSITFVCLGNICRSPIAEGCAIKLAQENNINIQISSSGTGSWHVGESPCENSIKVCKTNNVDISKLIASQFNKNDIDSYDLVVALDDKNVESLKILGAKNIVKLGSYGYDSQDVPDPYFFDGFEGFDKIFTMIDECVKNLFKEEQLKAS
jgi:protein-tyrosine phosphatase